MKLHQLLALLPTVKNRTTKEKSSIYQAVQKHPLFQGLSRTYQPREENGFVYPSESKSAQLSAKDLIQGFKEVNKELLNLTATQDWANCNAKADVVIDGVVILESVPVTNLLFLEKQVEDLKTFITSLPLLEPDKEWTYSDSRGCYVSSPKETVKTKKVTEFVVAYEATKEHPAQVKEVSKDIIEGTWTAVDFSGALKADTVRGYLDRVNKLHKAIVVAREEANAIEVQEKRIADELLNYVFPASMS